MPFGIYANFDLCNFFLILFRGYSTVESERSREVGLDKVSLVFRYNQPESNELKSPDCTLDGFNFQGQVIDRIDHNIENTQIKVEAGLKQLKQADSYQKKNRKMKCIVIEAVIVIVLLFILIMSKT